MRLLGYFAVIVVVSTLLSWFAPTPDSPTARDLLLALISVQAFFTDGIRDLFPTIAGGKYESGVFLIITSVVFKVVLTDSVKLAFENKIDELEFKGHGEELEATAGLPGREPSESVPLDATSKSRQPGDTASRAELLRVFAATKKKLDSMVKNLAFLSVDVVGSSAMKEGENASDVQFTFDEYKLFVTSILGANGALKSAWTPDGAMTCFPTADKAVKAAMEIVHGLSAFNKEKKTIRADFIVRCGVSAGMVHYDEATPMEEMSEYVVDLAGHMQKHGVPNGIFIPRNAYDKLWATKEGFHPANTVIDGHEVFVWTAKK
ncbi:MAG: guanylate cyclase [Nitrospinae bacterium]|nr:guanylate cyclase [Nitrospinota bacterium]